MNWLITGGCGFIGSNFIREALENSSARQPCTIVNVDKLTYAGNPRNLADFRRDSRYRFIKLDMGNRKKMAELLREFQVDAVVNFAAETHVDRSIDSPESFFQTNVISTVCLLDVCREYWSEFPAAKRKNFRFLHVSTDEVYGSLTQDDEAFKETTPYAPNSPYAASKASSDFIVRAYHHTYGLPVLTTNCSNNYGPYQFPEKLIPLMILNALESKPLPIYGDGQQIRDWLYVEDHARAIMAVLKSGRIGQTYNIGGDCEKTNLEVVHTICDLMDELIPRSNKKSYRQLLKFVKDRPGHDRRYAMNSTKLKKETGWEPLENFESGLRKTVEWYLDNHRWCEDIFKRKYQRDRLGLGGK